MLLRRVAGLALILVFLLTFHLQHPLLVHLALLVVGIIGLWLAIANVAAVALTVGLLALLNMRLASPHPLEAWVYPVLAAGGLITFTVVMAQRFVRHMHDTHEARWAERRRRREGRDAR